MYKTDNSVHKRICGYTYISPNHSELSCSELPHKAPTITTEVNIKEYEVRNCLLPCSILYFGSVVEGWGPAGAQLQF